MKNILYPNHRPSAKDTLWLCDACGAADWAGRKSAHECPANRDAWGKRTMTPMRAATPAETAIGVRALAASA